MINTKRKKSREVKIEIDLQSRSQKIQRKVVIKTESAKRLKTKDVIEVRKNLVIEIGIALKTLSVRIGIRRRSVVNVIATVLKRVTAGKKEKRIKVSHHKVSDHIDQKSKKFLTYRKKILYIFLLQL